MTRDSVWGQPRRASIVMPGLDPGIHLVATKDGLLRFALNDRYRTPRLNSDRRHFLADFGAQLVDQLETLLGRRCLRSGWAGCCCTARVWSSLRLHFLSRQRYGMAVLKKDFGFVT